MAGDWIKIEHALPDKPEVIRMADILGIDPDAVVGKLLRFWNWCDVQCVNGNALSVTKTFIDRITFCTGFASAMIQVGWLIEEGETLSVANFERHIGKTSKLRALANRRVAKHRMCNDESVTNVTVPALQKALPEKRREEKIIDLDKEREEEAALARSRSALDRSEIIAKINSIKPEWQKPAAWSAMELHDLHSALGQVSEMDDSDWNLLRRYMAARTQTGAGFWQPKSRGQFVANFGDVYGHAQRWASKDKPSVVRQPEQVQARDIIDRDSLKAIFG
jgi:hypothetical protein